MNIDAINIRYSKLADTNCCLSCGGAINYAKPQAGEVCVDLGSGKGNDALRMAELVGDNGFVYGIDISDGMLETARKNAAKFDVRNVEFIKCELESICLPTSIVNLVISNCTINHARNKQKVWNEIYRILKPGGRFVVSDIYSLNEIPAVYRNDPQAVAECWAGAVTRDEYMTQLDEAGFLNIKVLEESTPYSKGKSEVVSVTITGYKPEEDYKCC